MKIGLVDNWSYRLVALGVALILWASMLGRSDSNLVKEFELQFLLPPHVEVISEFPQVVRVEVSGPRVSLKRMNQMNPVFTVDLTKGLPGAQVVKLRRDSLPLPIGARVVSLEPEEISLVLKDNGPKKESE